MFTYRNKTDRDLMIPHVGEVKAGGTISSEQKLENVNLEEVSSGEPENKEETN